MAKAYISNEDLKNEVFELIKDIGRVPRLKEYDEKYKHRGMINARFGSWNSFLKSIDIEPVQRWYDSEECEVTGCNNKVKCKGMCIKHYAQYRRYKKISNRTILDRNNIDINQDYAIITAYNINCEVSGKILIDIRYIDKISKHKVYIDDNQYATIASKDFKMHLVTYLYGKLSKNEVYTYKNKNTLDCRKANVVVVDRHELNRVNRRQKRNRSGYKGIYINKTTGKYEANIGHNGTKNYIGSYDTLNEAVEARIEAEKYYWGKVYTKIDQG